MQNIVNGGVYRITFRGGSDSEFSGDHPTVVIRTLKENDIYLVVPLTTYTKEKMEKAKRKGFGYRIKSSNSIARIDKLNIVHKNQIKNRWRDNNQTLIIKKDELSELNSKVNDYIRLTGDKATKEYSKYLDQYEKVFNDLSDVYTDQVKSNNMFNVSKIGDNVTITCKKRQVHWLSLKDIIDITKQFYTTNRVKVEIDNDNLLIKIES